MLFPKKEILLLDGVSEALAFQIAHGKTSHPHSFFLYIVQNKLTKSWNDIPLVQVEFTEEEFRQWIQKIAGKSLYSQLSAPVLHSLYQRWKDFDLGEEDIFSFFHHYQPLTGLIPLDVELFFEKSEKTLLFRFIDALSDRNAELATKYFFSLQKINYPPNLLVVMVARRYRLIHQILLIGVDNQDLWKKNKVSPFEIRKIKNFAKKYSPSEITNIFSLLRDLDRLSKTVHCDFSDLMLDLIAQISVKILPSRSERVPSAFSPDEI